MVGTGYVGLVTGTCFANTGNDVTCLDVDEDKIAKLQRGISPIYEPGLDEMIQRNVKAGRLHFTTDKAVAYSSTNFIFICVGTPSDELGNADLRYVLAAAADIGVALESPELLAEGHVLFGRRVLVREEQHQVLGQQRANRIGLPWAHRAERNAPHLGSQRPRQPHDLQIHHQSVPASRVARPAAVRMSGTWSPWKSASL